MSSRRRRSRTRRRLSELGLWTRLLLYFVVHTLTVVAVIQAGITVTAGVVCVASTLLRIWGVSAGYHRYFTHGSFRTSRAFQLVLAVLAQTSGQQGVLWWASRERQHHAHADRAEDLHSPIRHGMVRAHFTWFLRPEAQSVLERRVPDLLQVPELVTLQRYWWAPTLVYGACIWLVFGWVGFVWGYLVSTLLVLHSTASLASVAHRIGGRRHGTPDSSRNSFLLALVTLGEGWHNNHHAVPSSAMLGWRPTEIDPTWRVLWVLQKSGLIWDMKGVRQRRSRSEERPSEAQEGVAEPDAPGTAGAG